MTKRFLSVLLAVIIFTLVPLSVSADTTVQPRYSYTLSHATTLIIKNNIAYCESVVNGDSSVTSVKMTLTLQKKVLWWWDDVTSWTDLTPDCSLSMSETYSVGSGTYRVKMTARLCAGSSDSEDIEGYSGEKSN